MTTYTQNQIVIVEAQNLPETTWCIFEHLSASLPPFEERNYSSLSTNLGDNLVICDVPVIKGHGDGWMKLELSPTNQIKVKSQSFIRLRITDKCPAGFYCLNRQIILCSPGHECPGGFSQQPPRRCPIGFYSDLPGLTVCKVCPRGFICPFPAMEQPMPCPPGFMCESLGMHSPTQCPEGYYCLAGSQGINPFDNGILTNMPYLCPRGSFCRKGMKTGVVLFSANTSLPSVCPLGNVCSEGSAEIGGVG